MKSIYSLKSLLWAVLLSTNVVVVGNASAVNVVDPCEAEKERITGWLNNSNLHQTVKDPDHDNFKFDTICEFNTWSWQMFMWLTQDVKVSDYAKTPRFLSDEFVSPYEFLGIANREVLKPAPSGHTEVFDEVFQAGSDGILVDKNGNAVYYSQYLNKTFTNFIDENDLRDPKVVQKLDPNTTFPVGTLELKASWRIVEQGDDTSKVFTMKGSVYGLKKKGNKITIDINTIRNVELALVGLHIGGVVEGHPEMIWATFEPVNNSPVVPSKFDPNTVIVDKDDDYEYTFYDQNPGASRPQATNKYSSCNKNYIKSPYMALDVPSQKLSPEAQVCLQYRYGNSASYEQGADAEMNASVQKTVEENDASIIELNGIVRAKLAADNPKDVWANYREVGAIWFRGSDRLKPDMSFETDFDVDGSQLLIGSLKLSNSTIETFTQYASAENNCFRCHNTEQRLLTASDGSSLEPLKPTNLNISHAFVNIYTWTQEMAKDQK